MPRRRRVDFTEQWLNDWALSLDRISGSLGYGQTTSLSATVRCGPEGARVGSCPGAWLPRDVDLPRGYWVVERALHSFPSPERYRHVLAIECGLFGVSESERARTAHLTEQTYRRVVEAIQARIADQVRG